MKLVDGCPRTGIPAMVVPDRGTQIGEPRSGNIVAATSLPLGWRRMMRGEARYA